MANDESVDFMAEALQVGHTCGGAYVDCTGHETGADKCPASLCCASLCCRATYLSGTLSFVELLILSLRCARLDRLPMHMES